MASQCNPLWNLRINLNDALAKVLPIWLRLFRKIQQLNDRLIAAAVIRDVGKEVGQMSVIGRSMQELQDFLKSPKLREYWRAGSKDLISQMFPRNSFIFSINLNQESGLMRL